MVLLRILILIVGCCIHLGVSVTPLSLLWSKVFHRLNLQGNLGLDPSVLLRAQQTQRPDQAEDRIYRGWYLDPHEFPWMVKIKALFPKSRKDGRHHGRSCGGALLSPYWVLSARHCVTWNPPNRRGRNVHKGPDAIKVKVYVGGHDGYGEDGQMIPAADAIGRNDYGRPQCRGRGKKCRGSIFSLIGGKDSIFTNDIVLIRLSQPVQLSERVQTVSLPHWNKDYTWARAFVSGWGIERRRSGSPASGYLKAAELRVVPGESSFACRDQTSWGKMCAQANFFSSRSGSVCPGDSGSPMVVWDEDNAGWTLVGLLSNGAKNCFKEMPAVFTRVGDYLPWIYQTMNSVP